MLTRVWPVTPPSHRVLQVDVHLTGTQVVNDVGVAIPWRNMQRRLTGLKQKKGMLHLTTNLMNL